MIAVQLNGGLGNQLFQYAVARALAEKNHTTPYLDLTLLLQEQASNDFYLNQLNLKAETNESYIKRWYFNRIKKRNLITVKENASVLNTFPSDYIFLKGYWQNQNYFGEIRDKLILEIKPVSVIESLLLTTLKNTESVAIHIRRGDYVGNELHEICTTTYFLNAINYVKSNLNNPIFYVFSDDINYCRQILNVHHDFVFIEETDPVKAFWLLKNSKHFIISNSSFSWWAQYLNDENRIVIAPPKWFKDSSINTDGIYCNHWKIIETA